MHGDWPATFRAETATNRLELPPNDLRKYSNVPQNNSALTEWKAWLLGSCIESLEVQRFTQAEVPG